MVVEPPGPSQYLVITWCPYVRRSIHPSVQITKTFYSAKTKYATTLNQNKNIWLLYIVPAESLNSQDLFSFISKIQKEYYLVVILFFSVSEESISHEILHLDAAIALCKGGTNSISLYTKTNTHTSWKFALFLPELVCFWWFSGSSWVF